MSARKPAWQDWDEKTWLEEIRKLARQTGWLTYHPHQSMRSEPGFPDLVLVRERVIYAELKRHTAAAKLSPHQILWRDRLLAAGAEWYEWRPAQAHEIVRILGRKRAGTSRIEPSIQRANAGHTPTLMRG